MDMMNFISLSIFHNDFLIISNISIVDEKMSTYYFPTLLFILYRGKPLKRWAEFTCSPRNPAANLQCVLKVSSAPR